MEFKNFIISIFLVGLIIIGIYSFSTGTQANYNVSQPLSSDERMGFVNDVAGNLTNSQTEANKSQSILFGSQPSVDAGGLMLLTIPTTVQTLVKIPQLVWDATIGSLATILGVSQIVIIIFTAMLTGLIVLLIWSLIRLGR